MWLLSCWEVKGFAWEQSHINSERASGLSLVTSAQEESLNQANVWWLHIAAEAQSAHHLLHIRHGWEGKIARQSGLQVWCILFFFLSFQHLEIQIHIIKHSTASTPSTLQELHGSNSAFFSSPHAALGKFTCSNDWPATYTWSAPLCDGLDVGWEGKRLRRDVSLQFPVHASVRLSCFS